MVYLSDIKIHQVPTLLSDPHSQSLSQRQREEILQTMPTLPPFATDIPFFLVLLKPNDFPIACGGLKPLPSTSPSSSSVKMAEIKRVYVVTEARGREKGVSDFLLGLLEKEALEQGVGRLRLQTGVGMVAANRFYERHGYVRLEGNYGEYEGDEGTVSYEKILA